MSHTQIGSFLLGVLTLCFATACYEDNIACLDLDATNYDILADQACPDCCVYPSFSVDVERFWGDDALDLDNVYTDGAGNTFRLIRFRTYLSELELVAGGVTLPTPVNEIIIDEVNGTDTTETTVNANLVLIASSGSTTATVGRLRTGDDALTALQGSFGLGDPFTALLPSSAPASSPLVTQAGLLNFNDGTGYLTASLEYQLGGIGDTLRVDLRGVDPVDLNFPGSLDPLRGVNLTLEINANYERLFAPVNLAQDSESVAAGIRTGLQNWLTVVGVR